jgi:hypothetical protein
MRDAPTRRLTANVPHGLFRRLIKRFAQEVPTQSIAQSWLGASRRRVRFTVPIPQSVHKDESIGFA